MISSTLATTHSFTAQNKDDLFAFWDRGDSNLGAFLNSLEIVISKQELNSLRLEWEVLQETKAQEEVVAHVEEQDKEIAPMIEQDELAAKGYTITPQNEGLITRFFVYQANGNHRHIGTVTCGLSGQWQVDSNARKTRKLFTSQADSIQHCIALWEKDCKSLEQTRHMLLAS